MLFLLFLPLTQIYSHPQSRLYRLTRAGQVCDHCSLTEASCLTERVPDPPIDGIGIELYAQANAKFT